ncbi:hypothetical protein B0A49_12589 [Cryomyces minteri]|uniref:DUF7371 domain-containing protein n=1 Tax=Cryomyces minteri TaxID=331657 RepID=A0A4U0WG68_9PEZI|nr:hypothetical protein B0A49_12589 [Cryomyces minteri]
MRFIVALTACALAGVALTQDTGTSTCEISTIYVPVPGPTATVTVSSVEASPQAESSASITTTNTALFTYTNFVTVAPSGSASEYYFSASEGTTTWLNSNAPPAYGSYVVGTTSVTVMPTPTITIVFTETATASATLSDSSSVVFAIGSANSDVTTTLHATSFVTLVQTSVNTLTMTHSPSSSFGPTYSGIGTSGWNMTSETMGTTTLTAAPVTLTEELQSAATSPAEVNSTLHLTATVRIPVTIKQSAISSALANATIATSTTSAPSTTETFDLSSALSSLHAGDASSFLSSLALASATKYGATAPTAASNITEAAPVGKTSPSSFPAMYPSKPTYGVTQVNSTSAGAIVASATSSSASYATTTSASNATTMVSSSSSTMMPTMANTTSSSSVEAAPSSAAVMTLVTSTTLAAYQTSEKTSSGTTSTSSASGSTTAPAMNSSSSALGLSKTTSSSATASMSSVMNATTMSVSTVSSSTSSSTAPTPTACGESGNFTINFDDEPMFTPSDNATFQAPPVFNPYHHLYYANGFSYVPPPTVPFPPNSPPRLAMYLSNDTGDIGSPNAGGMKAGELGAGPRGATDAYWIDAWSVYLGCDNEGPTDCTMVLSGYRWDTATGQETLHVQQNATLSPCPGYIDCHLQHVVLDSGFTSLTGFQIQAFVNETVDRTYFMDDLAMGWSNNTCAAGLLRISSRK